MTKTPEFLKGKTEEIDLDVMSNLETMIQQHDIALQKVAKFEAQLKDAKSELNRIDLEVIPDFLLQHGITKMALSDGREVKIKEDISATVKDEAAFRKWLKDRGEEDIIKLKYAFARMQPEEMDKLADFLCDNDYNFEIDESIHSQTKKKYFKELLTELNRADLPDWVNIYDIRKAIVK